MNENAENNNPYHHQGFGNNQNDANQYVNYDNSYNNPQKYMENNEHEEENYHAQNFNNPQFNVNSNHVYNYEAENNHELVNKYIEDDYNRGNNYNNFVNQSVKNIFPVQDKEANEQNDLRAHERNMDNYYQMGAYEKHKDQSYMGDSPNKENRTSFAYDSKRSKKNLQGKNNEVRYLQGTIIQQIKIFLCYQKLKFDFFISFQRLCRVEI